MENSTKRFAEAECYYCNQILPKNEMRPHIRWVGWAPGAQLYHWKHGTPVFATNFPWYRAYFCLDCEKKLRTNRAFRFIGLSIVAIILAFIFLASRH